MESNNKFCFILGAIPRCGSNYAFNLLIKHPDCIRVQFHAEDKILVQSPLLIDYINKTHASWYEKKGMDLMDQKRRLTQHISDGIAGFFEPADLQEGQIIINKTPFTQGINNFFTLFPNGSLIILLRSGRDAVESGRKSFGWPYDDAILRFRDSLMRIKKFVEKNPDKKDRIMLLKYEDLLKDETGMVGQMLHFLHLEKERYPFDAIATMPVKGSSSSKKEIGGSMNWEGFTDKSNFDPTKRSANWPKSIERMYYRNCNDLLAYFNYPIERFEDNALLRIKDSTVVFFKNIGGILTRAKTYSGSRIAKTISYRIKSVFKILIYGYANSK